MPANTSSNTTMASSSNNFTVDILRTMRKQEDNAYRLPTQHLKELFLATTESKAEEDSSDDDDEDDDDEEGSDLCHYLRWRSQMAEWCYNLAETCEYEEETVEIAMSMVDRYVAADPSITDSPSGFQIAVMTCMYTASKTSETLCLTPEQMGCLSEEKFTEADMEQAERILLAALQWRVNPPTAILFARTLVELVPLLIEEENAAEEIVYLCQEQIKMAVLDPEFLPIKASSIGFGALMNAIQIVLGEDTLSYYYKLFCNSLGLNKAAYKQRSKKIRSKLSDLALGVVYHDSDYDDEEQEDEEDTLWDVSKTPQALHPESPVSVVPRRKA